MNPKVKNLIALLVTVFLTVLITVFVCTRLFTSVIITPQSDNMAKLEQLEEIIARYYVDSYDETAIGDGAAEGMIDALGDPWSYYIPASEADEFEEQMNNAYTGVGVTVQIVDGQCEITAVQKDSPAEQAGICIGDVLSHVDGASIDGMDVDEIKSLVRGTAGTSVHLTLVRSGDEVYEADVKRAAIQIEAVSGKLLSERVGLITISNFDLGAAKQFGNVLRDLTDAGVKGLVFDLRNNPGGDRDELVTILDALLPEGEIFRCVDYKGAEERDVSDADCVDLPMAVIVDETSISAAEFFAAALQEYDWAEIVGERTIGKGNFQYTFELSDGSAAGISAGHYFTPGGKSLSGVGVLPDVPVALSEEEAQALYSGTLAYNDDPQMRAAYASVEKRIAK